MQERFQTVSRDFLRSTFFQLITSAIFFLFQAMPLLAELDSSLEIAGPALARPASMYALGLHPIVCPFALLVTQKK